MLLMLWFAAAMATTPVRSIERIHAVEKWPASAVSATGRDVLVADDLPRPTIIVLGVSSLEEGIAEYKAHQNSPVRGIATKDNRIVVFWSVIRETR